VLFVTTRLRSANFPFMPEDERLPILGISGAEAAEILGIHELSVSGLMHKGAISVAAVAVHNRRPNRVQVEDHTTIMRPLTERRDDLVAERTRWINRLQELLRDLPPKRCLGPAQRFALTD
jgi:hypothetical protein